MANTVPGVVIGASHIGARLYQEDRYIIQEMVIPPSGPLSIFKIFLSKKVLFIAVCDGHGGKETADYVSKHVSGYFQKTFQIQKGNIKEALRETVALLHESTKYMDSGTTLSVVVISDRGLRADIAVLGDSPVVISDDTNSIWISPEHNARTNIRDRDTAIAQGAYYEDGYLRYPESSRHQLQLSRTLGDRDFSRFLNRKPELFTVALGPESFVLVSSDGLLDPMHENTKQEMRHIIDLIRKGAKAYDLVDDAVGRETGDNVTAVLWRARRANS